MVHSKESSDCLARRKAQEAETRGQTGRASRGRPGQVQANRRDAHHEALRRQGAPEAPARSPRHGGPQAEARGGDRGGREEEGGERVVEELRGVSARARQQLADLPEGRGQEEEEDERSQGVQAAQVEDGEAGLRVLIRVENKR